MKTFRNILVLASVALIALAVGVLAGAGPLRAVDKVATQQASGTPEGSPRTNGGGQDPDAGQSEDTTAFEREFLGAVGPAAYRDGLADSSVAVVTLPGARTATVNDLGQQVRAAGGTLSGTYRLTGQLLDASQKSLVDTLGTQLSGQVPDAEVSEKASTYPRIGELLGRGIATTDGGAAQVDDTTTTITRSLEGARLMRTVAPGEQRADVVLVVAGEQRSTDAAAIVGGLLEGLRAKSNAVVLTGDTASGESGLLSALRSPGELEGISTVDGDESEAGRIAAVLALIGAGSGTNGHFGASGSDGAVPLG